MNRSGVALIIAISVLAALLLLALPFLFSQTSSIAGARAAAWDGVARRGADRAANLATALTVYATGLHRSPQLATNLGLAGQLPYAQLPQQIGDAIGPIRYPSYPDSAWRTVIDPGGTWTVTGPTTLPKLDGKDAAHGAIIEDESRRIDPNCLGERGWAIVLSRAGIQDPYSVSWSWTPGAGGNPPGSPYNLSSVGSWNQHKYGRLARALALWRPAYSRRYNRLEDLLGANPNEIVNATTGRRLGCTEIWPEHDPVTGMAIWPAPATSESIVEATRNAAEDDAAIKSADSDNAVNLNNRGRRVAALTQTELDRLRPLLTFLVPGQGRSGLIDLGTVVAKATYADASIVTDELSPQSMGVGQALRPNRVWIRRQDGTAANWFGDWLDAGDSIAFDAPPVVNINTIPADSAITRLYSPTSSPAGWPADPVLNPITTIGELPHLAWLDPRLGDGTENFERPPLGIQGFGIVAIEGAATARDGEGHATAERRRRTVMQAVPQERPFEAAWRTQGELEALLRTRQGSWVMAGPHPTNRIAAWGSVAGDMAALDNAGWLEPAPLCAFQRNPVVGFDWKVPFGLTAATTWEKILENGGTGTAAPSVTDGLSTADLRSSSGKVGALTAQGLHLDGSRRLAWDVDGSNGPLRFAANGNYKELSARHASMRFRLVTAPTQTVILMEARAQELGHDDGVDGIPDAHTVGQNLWRIEYRPGSQQLVLIIANAALPWTAADRTRLAIDGWLMGSDSDPAAEPDPRSLASGAAFAPADPSARVEFRYQVKGGLQTDRWYHLQAYCASDRPGLHGLILDGIVGRDATRAGVDMSLTGDHYTYPSLRLETAVAKTVITGSGSFAVPDLTLRYPVELNLADLLPERGLIRIDDEYFSYAFSSGTGGTGTLTGVQRARRINTDQAATEDTDGNGTLTTEDTNGNGVLDLGEDANGNTLLDTEDINGNGILDTTADARRWPVTQAHLAGAMVTPGWSQMLFTSGYWLHGGVHLSEPLPVAGLATGTALSSQLPDVDTDGEREFNNTVLSLVMDAVVGTWAPRGFVLITTPVGTARAYYTLSGGNTLTLDWGVAAGVRVISGEFDPTLAGNDKLQLRQVSLEVDGGIADGPERRFDAGGDPLSGSTTEPALQFIDESGLGRCEWIRYQQRIDLAGQGRFFLHDSGWPAPPATPAPLTQARGAMRTAYRSDGPWAATTTRVLPVQTHFNADRFEAGDVATVVTENVDNANGHFVPVQLVVRYACRDGYPATTAQSGPRYDTVNEWFALTHAVPITVPDPNTTNGSQQILIGRGWSGDDLSMVGNAPQRRGAMPRRVLLATTGASGIATCTIGGADPLSLVADPIFLDTTGNPDVIIDDLCAGELLGPADANLAAAVGATTAETDANGSEVIAFTKPSSGASLDAIGTAASDLPIRVQTSQSLFPSAASAPVYGMALMDGEVFAYRRIDATHADLIARAQLGSAALAHGMPPSSGVPLVPVGSNTPPTRPVRPTLTITILPMGPVGELCDSLTPSTASTVPFDVCELDYTDYFRDPPASGFSNAYQKAYANTGAQHFIPDTPTSLIAPFVLVSDPSNPAVATEVLRLIKDPSQANQCIVAPWLRGLYGTQAGTWTAGFTGIATNRLGAWQNQSVTPYTVTVRARADGELNPIVIGWWPRFAPGAAVGNTLTDVERASLMRSRSFAWAGFPLRLAGSRFDPRASAIPILAASGVADMPIATTAGCDVLVMALAAGSGAPELFDWDKAYAKAQTLTGSTTALVTPFDWDRFHDREVDGAEMRVHWLPSSSLSGLAAAADTQGRAIRLGATDLQAEQVPATGAGIRLRCAAPTRTLAVEEVR
jgi:hypothetical protein